MLDPKSHNQGQDWADTQKFLHTKWLECALSLAEDFPDEQRGNDDLPFLSSKLSV